MKIRITRKQLEAAYACGGGLRTFDAVSKEQGHGEAETLIYAEWSQSDIDRVLARSSGARWLHFLERKGFVPMSDTPDSLFPPELAMQRVFMRKSLDVDGFVRFRK